jgi:hypothetical protein
VIRWLDAMPLETAIKDITFWDRRHTEQPLMRPN